MANLIPCKITIEGVDGEFNALDTGKRWNGWFDGWVESTPAILKMFEDCGETIVPHLTKGGKTWLATNGYCFWPPQPVEAEDTDSGLDSLGFPILVRPEDIRLDDRNYQFDAKTGNHIIVTADGTLGFADLADQEEAEARWVRDHVAVC